MQELYNLAIERSILAAFLYDPIIFKDYEEQLESSDFSHKNHSEIFMAMKELNHLDLPIAEDFIRKKVSSNIDDDMFEILSTPPIVDIQSYIKELKDLSLKRKLSHLANVIHENSLKKDLSSIEIINKVESEIFKLQGSHHNKEFRGFSDVISSVVANVKEKKELGNSFLIGTDTGFGELNKMTTGFNKGELIIIAARPAMGKTALALNMIIPTLKAGKGVAFFSLEMDAEQLVSRVMSFMCRIPLQRLRIGDLDDKEWQYFYDKCNEYSSWKFYIDDTGGINITHLRSKLRKLKLKDPSLSLIVIDYLQIMSGINNKDRHLEVAEISRGLKILARELEVPIIALSQLNRSLESRGDRRPTLSDLRESGSIEQDADIILFIYRDSYYKRKDAKENIERAKKEGKGTPKVEIPAEQEVEEVEIIIGKHRNGPIGTIKVLFHTIYTYFANIDKNEIEYQNTKVEDEVDLMPI